MAAPVAGVRDELNQSTILHNVVLAIVIYVADVSIPCVGRFVWGRPL